MLQNLSWMDGLKLVCLVLTLALIYWFADGVGAYQREKKADQLVKRAKKQINSGANRTQVLAGLAYMAREMGVDKEVNDLWPDLDKQ